MDAPGRALPAPGVVVVPVPPTPAGKVVRSMPSSMYPIALDLHDKPCLVVGGGHIADDKLDALLAAGARVTVVAPEVRPRIAALAADGRIVLRRRAYRPGDVAGAFLVIAATDDRPANARVATDGRAAGALVNAVDDIPFCDFFAVAIVRRGDLQLGISTNGRSPAFARWMRERLDAEIPASYAGLLAALGETRDALKARGPVPDYPHWQTAIGAEIAGERDGDAPATIAARLFERLSGPARAEEVPA